MENTILQEPLQGVKQYLPSPYPAHKLIIKKKSLKAIMAVKGWSSYTAVANALGFTRQYIAMIANGVPVSAEFVCRMALALGSRKANWYIHYDIVPRGFVESNHPTWNMQKHDGQIPYEKFSVMEEVRKQDYSVEKKVFYV